MHEKHLQKTHMLSEVADQRPDMHEQMLDKYKISFHGNEPTIKVKSSLITSQKTSIDKIKILHYDVLLCPTTSDHGTL